MKESILDRAFHPEFFCACFRYCLCIFICVQELSSFLRCRLELEAFAQLAKFSQLHLMECRCQLHVLECAQFAGFGIALHCISVPVGS
jgi:hypothetical protein